MRTGFLAFYLTIVALLSGCGSQGVFYEKSPQDIRSALKSATLPYFILGGVRKSKVTQPHENTVAIGLLGPDDREVARFVTTITPEGTGSRVAVEVLPPTGKHAERVTKSFAANPSGTAMLQTLANEHVAAAIEGRPFNIAFRGSPMVQGLIAADPRMRAQFEQASRAAAEMSAFEESKGASGHYNDVPADYDAIEAQEKQENIARARADRQAQRAARM